MIVVGGDIANNQFLAVIGDGIKTRRMEVKGLSLEISYIQTSIRVQKDGLILNMRKGIVNGLEGIARLIERLVTERTHIDRCIDNTEVNILFSKHLITVRRYIRQLHIIVSTKIDKIGRPAGET